jgi:hypothetical protein
MKQSPSPLRSITINAYGSPEGSKALNLELARQRAENLKSWLLRHTSVPDSLFRIGPCEVNWAMLEAFVRADSAVPYREKVLFVITDVPEETRVKGRLTDSRTKRLMEVYYGRSYHYLDANYFSRLRYCEITSDLAPEEFSLQDTILFVEETPEVLHDIELPKVIEVFDNASIGNKTEDFPVPTVDDTVIYVRRPLFAVKTNLLYDLALTPNLEMEIPLGSRWSINGEFQHGWWGHKYFNYKFCWQFEGLGAEVRYWLGNRTGRPVLTGWFLGVFTGAGVYDLQMPGGEGYQSDFQIGAGLSAGYAKKLSGNWQMEFSLGAGYLTADRTRYRVIDRELVRQGADMRFKGVLPLKAKISLSYLLTRRVKQKGGTR